MLSKFKSLKHEHLPEIILIILAIYNFRKFFGQISNHLNIPKVIIAHQSTQNSKQPLYFTKRAERLHKLDTQVR